MMTVSLIATTQTHNSASVLLSDTELSLDSDGSRSATNQRLDHRRYTKTSDAVTTKRQARIDTDLARLRTLYELYYDNDVLSDNQRLYFDEFDQLEDRRRNRPCLWLIFDKDDHFSRCGVTEEMATTLHHLVPFKSECYVVVVCSLSWYCRREHDLQVANRFKQDVRRVIKGLIPRNAGRLDDYLFSMSCRSFKFPLTCTRQCE